MTNKEGTIVGSIYTIIILLYVILGLKFDLDKQKLATLEAQKLAVILHEEKKEAEVRLDIARDNVWSLNKELDEYEKSEDKIKKIVKEMRTIDINNENISIMVMFTESSFNGNVIHPKASVQGRCGVDVKIWGEELRENEIEIDSLEACDYIFSKYLEQYGSKKKALLKYKSVEKNKKVAKIVDKILQVDKKLDK